jgi:hypothetical protein
MLVDLIRCFRLTVCWCSSGLIGLICDAVASLSMPSVNRSSAQETCVVDYAIATLKVERCHSYRIVDRVKFTD